MRKKVSIPLVIIILALCGTGFFLYFKLQKRSTIKTPKVEKTQILEKEVEEWKTYRDEKEGFEIEYPKNWNVFPITLFPYASTDTDGIILTNETKEKIEKLVNQLKESETQEEINKFMKEASSTYIFLITIHFSSPEAFLKERKTMCQFAKTKISCSEKEIKIGEKNGYQFINEIKEGKEKVITTSTTSFMFYGNKRIYLIEPFSPYECSSGECEIFKKILSNFKLIDIAKSTEYLTCEYKKPKIEFRIYDLEGRMTGTINGEKKQQIPNTTFTKEGGIQMPFPIDTYYEYEIYGIKEGNYNLEIPFSFNEVIQKIPHSLDGKKLIFKAINIPISTGMVHRYKIDWKKLGEGKAGVTLVIDINDDGKFEKSLAIEGVEFTCQQFLSQLNKIEQKEK
jgi:hypothetical protein